MLGVQEVSKSNYKTSKTFNGPFLTMSPWISSSNWWKFIPYLPTGISVVKKKKKNTWKLGLWVRFQRKGKNGRKKKLIFNLVKQHIALKKSPSYGTWSLQRKIKNYHSNTWSKNFRSEYQSGRAYFLIHNSYCECSISF